MASIRPHADVVATGDCRVVRIHGLRQACEVVRRQPIVGVEKEEPCSARLIDADVASRRGAAICLAHNTDAWIRGGEALRHFHCRVTRTVVDDESFPVGETLLERDYEVSPRVWLRR